MVFLFEKVSVNMSDNLTHSVASKQRRGLDLPARITYEASKQTYYTFRFLVDRQRKQIAYRSYAYFRWLDDIVDSGTHTQEESQAFVRRQEMLLEACYRGESPSALCPEEQMLADMVDLDHRQESGLQIYLRNMMKVMAFDVERRGRVISHAELTEYTHWLAKAVSEALFYFIGSSKAPPCDETRYHAVCGAHVVHMLRDCIEDASTGYFNIPGEYIHAQKLSGEVLNSLPFRKWVYGRVKLARQYFVAGRNYFSQVKNFRCRLASSAYLARFEWMLIKIEHDGYCLRPAYPERKSLKAALWMSWRIITSVLKIPQVSSGIHEQIALPEQCEER